MCEMTPKEQSYEPIRLLELNVANEKRKWLEKHGWKERCDFPDSCWRWCKEIEGKLMMCSENKAIKIERDFLPDIVQQEIHKEGCGCGYCNT